MIMKTVMKTFGILSLLFTLTVFTSCEEKDDLVQNEPEAKEELFAISTRAFSPEETAMGVEMFIKKGVVVGTQKELMRFIDDIVSVDPEDDTSPSVVGMSVSSSMGWTYRIFTPEDISLEELDDLCRELYYQAYLAAQAEYQDEVNHTCIPHLVIFECPYSDKVYMGFSVKPNNGCSPGGNGGGSGDILLYEDFQLHRYPFGVEDNSGAVEEYIENLFNE